MSFPNLKSCSNDVIACVFPDYFLELFNRSEASLQTSFQTGFGSLFSQNAKVFQDLYSDLRHYYRGSRVNLEEALNEFWARLLERLFKVLNPQYIIGEEYLECVAKQSETLKPFGDTPRELKTKITRTVIAARTFVQGLVISGEAVRKVSQVFIFSRSHNVSIIFCHASQPLVTLSTFTAHYLYSKQVWNGMRLHK